MVHTSSKGTGAIRSWEEVSESGDVSRDECKLVARDTLCLGSCKSTS